MMKLLQRIFQKNKNFHKNQEQPWNVDLDALMKNREAFNAFVYTDLEKALVEVKNRWDDIRIPTLKNAPDILKNGGGAVLPRQIATGNYEVRRFVDMVEPTNLKPIFWEYYDDKFTSNNGLKRALGKIPFYAGIGKKGGIKIDRVTIVDFNTYNGKPISSVKTRWGESLIDFHHRLLKQEFKSLDTLLFDASSWFLKNGKDAKSYYTPFMRLYTKHAILFENFLLDGNEYELTRFIFLPAFIKTWKETGHKPLIVSLVPTETESDSFWVCHPYQSHSFVKDCMKTSDSNT